MPIPKIKPANAPITFPNPGKALPNSPPIFAPIAPKANVVPPKTKVSVIALEIILPVDYPLSIPIFIPSITDIIVEIIEIALEIFPNILAALLSFPK